VTEGNVNGFGRFISLEGGEGAGKSTQASVLKGFLNRAGKEVILTREPGGSPGAEQIRNLIVSGDIDRWDKLTEVLLLYAARRDHWLRTIQPALSEGSWVISDRFSDSTLVYQGLTGVVDTSTILTIHKIVLGDVWPDLTLVLDLPPEVGLTRSLQRDVAENSNDTRFEKMSLEFHQRLRKGFQQLALDNPKRFEMVDSSRDQNEVGNALKDIMFNRFKDELEAC